MKKTLKEIVSFLFLGVIMAIFVWQSYQVIPATASAPPGYRADQPTTSQITLAQGESIQVFATSTCVSRIVSTGVTSLWITFVDSAIRPSVNVGHFHATSTTVGYDAGIYGCGLVRMYNPYPTTTLITITEFGSFR